MWMYNVSGRVLMGGYDGSDVVKRACTKFWLWCGDDHVVDHRIILLAVSASLTISAYRSHKYRFYGPVN